MAHKTRLLSVLAISLMTSMPAMAQQTEPTKHIEQRNFPAEGLSSAIRQVEVSAVMYAQDMQRQLQAKDARITELEGKCGDPCKQAPAPSASHDKP